MLQQLYKGRYAFAIIALTIMCFGFATPALADGEPTYEPGNAKLTAVIVGPAGTDASHDSYVFHFAGGGTVNAQTDNNGYDRVYSDGVEQDTTTIKGGDIVPTIGDVTLTGVKLTADNSLTNGQMSQAVVQKSLSEVLSGVTFPHAGVYTYVVTENPASAQASDCYINTSSKAEYIVRIRVKNSDSNVGLEIDGITVQQTKNDNGSTLSDAPKVNPTYPKTTSSKISETAENTQPESNKLAGDGNGFNVPGFTFANEYIKCAPFQVKKLYDGKFSDKTKYSTVELTIHSTDAVAAVKPGSALTYKIEGGGTDKTPSAGTLNEDSMATFDSNGWAYIKAELMEGSSIRITGLFGPESGGKRETISAVGLTSGLDYTVIEGNPYDYRPTGYVYVGADSVDPRTEAGKNATGMSEPVGVRDQDTELPYNNQFELPSTWAKSSDGSKFTLPPFAFYLTGNTTGSNTTVFVVNAIDENKVAPTGILIENLPYILMISIPVIVFIALFVLRRRRNASE